VSVGRVGAVALVVAAAAWPISVTAQSIPACQIATSRDGQTVTVGVRASPGIVLRVEWGDGTVDETVRATSPNRGRAFLRHEYAAPGTYAVRASATIPNGPGCVVGVSAQLPDTSDVGPGAAAVLPPPGRTRSSDEVEDRELGESMAEAPVPVAPPRSRTPLEVIRDFLGSLFGG
jgi:hypothetical protein